MDIEGRRAEVNISLRLPHPDILIVVIRFQVLQCFSVLHGAEVFCLVGHVGRDAWSLHLGVTIIPEDLILWFLADGMQCCVTSHSADDNMLSLFNGEDS